MRFPLLLPVPGLIIAATIALVVAAAPLARADDLEAPAPDSTAIPIHRWQSGLLRPDRMQHASLSFSIGLGAGLATDSPAAGAGIALGLGLAKELVDRRRSRFDAVDLLADALGAALAAWAVSAIAD